MPLEEGITALATYTVDNAINDVFFKVFTKYLLAIASAFGAMFVGQLRQVFIAITAVLGVLGTLELMEILFKLTRV